MKDFNWKGLIGSVAPTIATALGGPAAGMAVKALGTVLLGDENASEKQISQAMLSATPDQLLALKKADQDFAVKMEELGIKLEELNTKDRDSARNLHAKVQSWIVPTLSGITVLGFFAIVAWVLTGKVILDSTILGYVLGQVSAKAEQVYNFHFGSSAGSKQKTEILNLPKDK